MPRGFKVDYRASLVAHQEIPSPSGRQPGSILLVDKRSFISQPKIIKGECAEPRPHLILYGVDKAPIRAEIFKRNREKHKLTILSICETCGELVQEFDDGASPYPLGEWAHVRNKPGERCDCPENGRVACRACHSERHPKPQFGRSKIVSESA